MINRLLKTGTIGLLGLLLMNSCKDDKDDPNSKIDWDKIDRPVVVDKNVVYAPEMVEQYDVLKSYVDRTASPNFVLGGALSIGDYLAKTNFYTAVNENFEEFTLGYAMKHGAVVRANGSLALGNVTSLLELAKSNGVTVFGHTLCWHSNQNATYLNSIIAPEMVPSEASMGEDLISNGSFDDGTMAGWSGWGNSSTRGVTSEGEGLNDEGYAFWVKNPTITTYWKAQTSHRLPTYLENGELYQLTFWVRGDGEGNIIPEMQSPDTSSDRFGDVTVSKEWKQVSLIKKMTKADRNNFIISYGEYVGTVYMDNFSLRKVGELVEIEKGTSEKYQIIEQALETWIKEMLTVCSPYVKAWDVVNEPMDDGKPYELKTGVGLDNMAADHFFWQDYLGKDYAAMAFKLARKYGNPDDLHFINDYNLEYNIDKTKGIIEYVKYIESMGAQVDGIGTQMHISNSANKDKIVEMFKLLAATGKLIKISELDVGVGVTTPDAKENHYIEQADMYKFVVEKYLEIIPAKQQYGITVWALTDSPENSYWRANQPIGLWTEDFVRKPAYAGFANGLAGKYVSLSFEKQK